MATDSTQLLTAPEWHTRADITASETCPHCATSIGGGEEFCPHCGYQRGTWGNQASPAAAAGTDSSFQTLAPTRLMLAAADGTAYPLSEGETIVGRGEVALRINDGFISRQHARFNVDGDSVTVVDLGSSNGTYLEDQRLVPNSETSLALDSTVRVGQLELTLQRNPNYADDPTAVVPVQESAADGSATAVIDTSVDLSGTEEPEPEAKAPACELSPWRLVGTQTIDLPLGELTVGRKADASDYILAGDGFVSGRHCKFSATADNLSVTDLGSTNGTSLNGTRLEPSVETLLTAGDKLLLGQTELSVERGEAASEGGTEQELPDTSA